MKGFTTNLSRRQTLVGAGLLALGVPLVAAPGRAMAQQATVVAAPPDVMAGMKVEALASGSPPETPGSSLLLLRITMDPGKIMPPHRHPGPVALTVLSGLFGSEFFIGTGQVNRVANAGTPGPVIQMKPGSDITMQPGDSLFYDGAVHTMRNDGKDPLVLLASVLFASDQPGFIFVQVPGTPTS